MKKRILALLMAATMVFGLAACGGKDDTNAGNENNAGTENQVATDTNITIWVAENVVDFTKEKVATWQSQSESNGQYTIEVLPVGEGDAAGNMITDVTGGADMYGFAQDQLTRLVAAGALAPVMGDNATWISTNNDGGAASAAKMGDITYAYPMTSDNGYFLYYDKSVITDPSSLDAIIAACEAAGKNFYYDIRGGWYNVAFFQAAGCYVTYDTDATGAFTACNINYANDNGVAALKAMIELAKSPSFQNGASIGATTNAAAVVTGTWDKESADALWGADGYGCVKLPTVTINGEQKQMGGFGGFKLLGIKPQTDSVKLAALHSLAQYLTGAEVQQARFESVGWGPSNLTAQASDAVKSDKALSALAEQLNYTIGQGQYPSDYWTLCEGLGDTILADTLDNATDSELLQVLTDLETKLKNAK
ncbi:MAG: extracellular solute-binding protein [Lachnospiraceae bacterium]|nr:extracellular solute-binding protein [Lachnospiraceae bacterium]